MLASRADAVLLLRCRRRAQQQRSSGTPAPRSRCLLLRCELSLSPPSLRRHALCRRDRVLAAAAGNGAVPDALAADGLRVGGNGAVPEDAPSSGTASTSASRASPTPPVAARPSLLDRIMPPSRQKLTLMCSLFFCMAFANSILDATKDALVVTALGGAEQIPFLTVWAVLPFSIVFVVAFSWASVRVSRVVLFNAVVASFLAFLALFTFFLFPNRASLQPTRLTSFLTAVLPPGLAGGVAVLHNWTLTCFYVAAESWGDVVLSLLFWGLANEITAEREAMVVYPLFGLGANVAQFVAGRVLKGISGSSLVVPTGLTAAQAAAAASTAWDAQLRALMVSVFAAGGAVLALHALVAAAAPRWAAASAQRDAAEGGVRLRAAAAAIVAAATPKVRKLKKPPSLGESVAALAASPQVKFLAFMAIAQGLSSNVFQVAWKTQLRALYPDPSAYSAFMGDVTTVSALATGAAMLLAPLGFSRLGWAGAASFTPAAMISLGWAFFGASAWAGFAAASARPPPGLLTGLAVGGAAVYIFEKAAKFALFKPAEEMVYLGLDEAARVRGKAAVDVCATQVGKAGGSLFQQSLLLAFGSLGAALPALAACHTACVSGWLWAVASLRPSMESRADLQPIRAPPKKDAAAAAAVSAVHVAPAVAAPGAVPPESVAPAPA